MSADPHNPALHNPEPGTPGLHLRLNPRLITLFLAAGVVCFAAAHAALHLVRRVFDLSVQDMGRTYALFDLGTEANLPTWFSTLKLLLAAVLLFAIARCESARRSPLRFHWWLLTAGIFLMSVDEAAQIHEFAGPIAATLFGEGEGVFFYSWYKLYIPLVVLIGLLFIPFLRRLPLAYTLRFAIAGGVFLAGALGVEVVEAYLASRDLPGRSATKLIEETLEMAGVVLFIHALLLYLRDLRATLQVSLSPAPASLRLAAAGNNAPSVISSSPRSTPPPAPSNRHSA